MFKCLQLRLNTHKKQKKKQDREGTLYMYGSILPNEEVMKVVANVWLTPC